MYTISFAFYDDLYPVYGPIHKTFDILTKDNISKIVKEIINDCQPKDFDYPFLEYMDSYYESLNNNSGIYYFIMDVVDTLYDNEYFVWNRFGKYYVIAFAINYTRFEIFSKDVDKILIKWREDDKNDPIKSIITNENYNENPVITFIKELSNK